MKKSKKWLSLFLACVMAFSCCACDSGNSDDASTSDTKAYIEETLNLANNENQEWTYDKDADAWVLSVVSAVAYPEIEDQQGVSVCVPGAYVTGIDTNGDDKEDVTPDSYSEAVKGSLVIDYEASVTSTNGQTYTASTAPVILNTGAAGYGSQTNSAASTSHAKDGYINVSCGNRGKQDTAEDEDGNTYYTGDAPTCLADQKAAARYVKYNILLGNLPGSVDYLVSTGGSGGGAHAAMFAATSNNSDFYDYQIEAGAVGVYKTDDGYSTTVTIDGTDYDISDGAWGSIAYSAITSLEEADMALAFEYYMDTTYDFNTEFQAQLAQYLSESYMEYINSQNLSVDENAVGFDLNADGDTDDNIALTIECDIEKYPETNGYYGTYLDLYLAEFTENLQWYLDNLDYSDGWTWFDADGNALSDKEVAAMTSEEKAEAFLEGRYAKGSTGGNGMMMGGRGDGNGRGAMGNGEKPTDLPDGANGKMPTDLPNGANGEAPTDLPDGANGEMPTDLPDGATNGEMPTDLPNGANGEAPTDLPDGTTTDGDTTGNAATNEKTGRGNRGNGMPAGENGTVVGTPDAGTTQSATGSVDSSNYETYADMVASYKEDIASVEAGDEYGNNIVSLYNPLNYIGADGTENPTWTKIIMGASEGDMSMFTSLNLQLAWLNAGVDAELEWQWDGGHVPSEILGESFSLYVDQMYGEHVEGATEIKKADATPQSENGTAEAATGKDITSWVNSKDITNVSFTLADAAAYRTAGASKAMPGFDVIDYGQEDYVFGNSEQDARHWNKYLLEIFEEYQDVLEPLFNQKSE